MCLTTMAQAEKSETGDLIGENNLQSPKMASLSPCGHVILKAETQRETVRGVKKSS